MSVVDLSARLTDDWDNFNRYQKSSDSLIFVEGPIALGNDGPAALNLFIGQSWFNERDGSSYLIPPDGLLIRPHQVAVIETQQRLALPLNIFGFVTGKGKFIFQALFISSGKIDPGFNGRLRIGVYNGGEKSVLLKPGESFCFACFLEMESCLEAPLREYEVPQASRISLLPLRTRTANWLAEHWYHAIPIVISLIAVIVSILK
jgi:dUTPase